MKKGLLWALVGSFALVGGCLGVISVWAAFGTAAHAEGADRFLALIADGSTHEAYASAASTLHAHQGEETFTDVISAIGPVDYRLDSWPDRTLPRGERAWIEATIRTQTGRDLPVILVMFREEGEWRVDALTDWSRDGVGPGAWFRQPPGESGLQRLVAQTLADFRSSVSDGRFLELNGKMFSAFKTFDRPTVLHREYRPFVDPEIPLSQLVEAEIELAQDPKLGRIPFGDVLIIPGYFNTEPAPIPFRYLYVYKHPEWRLFAVQIRETFEGVPSPF